MVKVLENFMETGAAFTGANHLYRSLDAAITSRLLFSDRYKSYLSFTISASIFSIC